MTDKNSPENQSEFINVDIKDETTGKIVGNKLIRNNIFIDAAHKHSWFRIRYIKLIEKVVNMLIDHADKRTEHRRRYRMIHKIVKEKIVHVGLKMCDRFIGKHMIKKIEDIPAESYNNHQRIFLDSWLKSIDDMWSLLIYRQMLMNPDKNLVDKYSKLYPTPEKYVSDVHKQDKRSHHARVLLGQLYMTEVLEDTADRCMNDCFLMRITHSMMEFYGIKPEERNKVPKPGQYPIFLSNVEKDKNYFISFVNIPTWYPKDSKEQKIKDLELELFELKEKMNQDKTIKNKNKKGE